MKLNITQKGKELMLRCMDLAGAGEILTFTHLVLGNGAHTNGIGESLLNPLLYLGINSFERKESSVELTSVFDNSAVSDRFRITEMGVLVKDPENEEATILFAYGYVPENEASVVPAVTDLIFETSITVSIYIGSLDNIEVALEGKLQGVSKETFESHINDYSNPHKVTAKSVGLENVENVAFTEHTPVYTIPEKLSEITPGEKFALFLGKVGKGIADLIAHIKNENNPHKTTCEQVGAAKSDHKHSANDISSGILSIQRGGTGVESFQELFNKFTKNGFSRGCYGSYIGTGKNGRNNPCKLEFDFNPNFVYVNMSKETTNRHLMLVRGQNYAMAYQIGTNHSNVRVMVTWLNNAVEWYYEDDSVLGPWLQLNDSETYFYVAG